MGKQVFRTNLVANGAFGNVFSALAALLQPPLSTCKQRRDSTLHLRPRSPLVKRVPIESEKKTFAKLLDSRQPRGIAGKWRAPHG